MQERKTWQEQVETVKSENEALQDLLRKKETAIKAAHVFEKVQQEQLDRQTLEIAGLKVMGTPLCSMYGPT